MLVETDEFLDENALTRL